MMHNEDRSDSGLDSGMARGLSWDHDSRSRRIAIVALVTLLALAMLPTSANAAPKGKGGVTTTTTTTTTTAAPTTTTTTTTVAPTATSGAGWQDASDLADYNPEEYLGSMVHVNYKIGADGYWSQGYTGAGIDVALIDTGVVPVEGLTTPGKIVNGPDLSFESQSTTFRYLDTYGHGTHMAGIIAGRDSAVPDSPTITDAETHFVGIAPGARIVSVKVAGHDGAVDVSQLIAAVDWVAQHKNDNGLNIRVLNISFGTDSLQSHLVDPLSHAVERAWKAGIVVVVASGNDGNDSPVRNPATNPHVITVGAIDGMRLNGKAAEPIPTWSSCGTTRTVDLVAPGASIVALRNPGSSADLEYPQARVAGRYFLGSGTSQAAAVVSGAAALILQQRPELSPDQVKSVLMDSASPLRKVSQTCQGAGVVDLYQALWQQPAAVVQQHVPSTGTGSLEAARGTHHVEHDGVVLEGEIDIFGNPWDGTSWALAATLGASWSGGSWSGATWTGASWSGASWSGASWSGASWSGASWSGASWSDMYWSGASWSGASWSGASWSGASWSGSSWSTAR